MSSSSLLSITYGLQREFSCPIAPEKLLGCFEAPRPAADPAGAVRAALEHPIEFPRLRQAILPDDRVVVVLDLDTPDAPTLIAGLWEELSQSRLDPERLLILQPVALDGHRQFDPREALPKAIRNRIEWKIHDATDERGCAYLASTAGGERVYLSRDVIDADVVITVGETTFDQLLGYRGTSSVLYPGLSNIESIKRCRGQGHRELSPNDERPLREITDEAAWLLGTQFTIQVIASTKGHFSHVLAGAIEPVFRDARQLLADHWLIQIDERPDLVVASVDLDAGGHRWKQITAALATARHLVERGGKIVVLSDLRELPGDGIGLLKKVQDPRDCYQPLRELSPPDLNEANELLDTLDHAGVYLLSQLPAERIEELHMFPLGSVDEAQKVIAGATQCVVVESAQHAWGELVSD